MSRFFKLAELLSKANGKYSLKKKADQNFKINSWEDMEEHFGDLGQEIRQDWEEYINTYDTLDVRTENIKSFLDFYNKKDLEELPEEAKEIEVTLLPDIKRRLKEYLNLNTPLPKVVEEPSAKISGKKASGVFGGASPSWLPNGGFENGPQQHQKRHAGKQPGWESNNAWDLLAPAGTVVHSLTKGRVTAIKPSSSKAYNIFGTHIAISGLDGYPDMFYTHVDNVSVNPGDIVEVGTPLAQITTPPPPPPDKDGNPQKSTMPHHVHVGIKGQHISSLMSSSGKFKELSPLRRSLRTFV